MQLVFNQNCPKTYQPEGFIDLKDQSIIVKSRGANLGALDTGSHESMDQNLTCSSC
jgi:hypothetical protein